ncbi:MAG: hypothetical protein AAF698_02755 [Pseudomonadota bacterium]
MATKAHFLVGMVLGVAGLLAPLSAPQAQSREGINPCGLTGFDAPCKVHEGEYRAYKPKGEGPFPAFVYLYGSGGRADNNYGSDLFRQVVTERGYVLIVPEALDVVNYNTGRDTGWSRAARRDEHPRDDIAFISRVIEHARSRFQVDRRRVLIVGQSDGGFLIWEIACHQPRLAAAYAVHAGTYGGPLPARCQTPVRFLHAHGRRDRIVPFEAELHWPGWTVKAGANPVEGLDLLARTNGCRDRSGAAVSRYRGFTRISWQGCNRTGALDYLVHGGGHAYPARLFGAVLDWFEGFDLAPPKAGQRNVRRPGDGTSRFKAIPQRRVSTDE